MSGRRRPPGRPRSTRTTSDPGAHRHHGRGGDDARAEHGATERAARTHPDAPPHLPALAFADHAEEMAGILYAPELLAPPPTIWLPNDAGGIGRSEAYDLQRYHSLQVTVDVRSMNDVLLPETRA